MILNISSAKDGIIQLIELLAIQNSCYSITITSIEEFERFSDSVAGQYIDVTGIIFYSHLYSGNKIRTVLPGNAFEYISTYFNKPVVILTTNRSDGLKEVDNLKVVELPICKKELRSILNDLSLTSEEKLQQCIVCKGW